jgi:hypothetical protein
MLRGIQEFFFQQFHGIHILFTKNIIYIQTRISLFFAATRVKKPLPRRIGTAPNRCSFVEILSFIGRIVNLSLLLLLGNCFFDLTVHFEFVQTLEVEVTIFVRKNRHIVYIVL